jgi:type I restriction enzyme S subunit
MSEDATLDEFVSENGRQERTDEAINTALDQATLGNIPSDWDSKRLKEITLGSLYGVAESADGFDPDKPRYLRITDISEEGVLKENDKKSLNREGIDEKYQLQTGQLLFARSGATVGKTYLYSEEDPEAVYGGYLIRFIPDTEQVVPKYLFYYTQSGNYDNWVTRVARQGAQKNINAEEYKSILLPVPSHQEQRKIATVLYTVDEAIQKTEEIIEKYQSIISGLIQDIATTGIDNKNLDKQKVPMLPERWEIPTHWELDFLENITTLITDGAHQTPTYVEDGIPFLKVEDIKEEKIDWDSVARIPEKEHNDLIKRGNPTKGDVLLSKNGTIGISKVVEWDREFSHFVSLALIRPNQDIILPDYLSTLLQSQICMRQANARSKTGTVTNLHLEEIEKLSIPVPPIAEQREILERISAIKYCLNLEVRYRNRLQRLKRGLMQDLLSGTVRTTDTNIEVPEEIAQYG